tara:strand:+ start:2474 stop:3436 length:963 start_codon:yes stop_codon:yes gene_type:complete
MLNSEEIFSLKNQYEVEIGIEGTDQNSVKKGMKSALSSLLISLSGNSTILNKLPVKKALNNPETFISQYKLELTEDGLISIFSFEGSSLRLFFSQNSLPLWVSKNPIILTFLPCKEDPSYLYNSEEKIICDSLEKSLKDLSSARNSKVTYPLMDLKDINYFESLNSLSANRFMNKLNRRYLASSWILCFTKDSFGISLDAPICQSSESKGQRPLEQTYNELLDIINLEQSLVVDQSLKNITKIKISGISNFSKLEDLVRNINTQVLVYDAIINEIEDDQVIVSISHYGQKEDFLDLLEKNTSFEIIMQREDIISFKYINS